MAYSSGTFSRLYDWTTDRDAGVKIRADRMDEEFDGIATGLTTAILKDGTQTTTAVVPFAFGISIVDNKAITLGTNSDITIQYDETTNDSLEIAAAVEGAALGIVLKSDQGDDNADQHKLSIADGGTLTLASKISGSFVTYLTHTPNSTVASSTLAVAGNLTVAGDLTVSGDDLTMGTNTSGHIMVADGTNFNPVAVSGDVTIASNGAVTIASTAVENSMLAGSIANAKLSNSSITVSDGSNTSAVALGGTLTFSGTSNEVEVAESSGTVTIGLPSAITANVTGALTGNADTATALATGRTIGMTGDVVWTSASFTGAGNVTGSATIQAGAVENSMLADDAVGADELAANAVVTASIVDDNVTQAKIADDAVGADQLASNAVVNASVASGAAIDATKIHDGSISNTEFGHLNSVSSNIQTQLDAKTTLTAASNEATALAIALG